MNRDIILKIIQKLKNIHEIELQELDEKIYTIKEKSSSFYKFIVECEKCGNIYIYNDQYIIHQFDDICHKCRKRFCSNHLIIDGNSYIYYCENCYENKLVYRKEIRTDKLHLLNRTILIKFMIKMQESYLNEKEALLNRIKKIETALDADKFDKTNKS